MPKFSFFFHESGRMTIQARHRALPIDLCFVCWLCSLFLFHYEMTKTKFIFYKRENGSWIWKAWRCPLEFSSKFQCRIVCRPRPFFKWPNLKAHVGHMTHFDQFPDWTLPIVNLMNLVKWPFKLFIEFVKEHYLPPVTI